MNNITFGNILENLLYISNQKKSSLANALGYDISYINKWISSKNLPSAKRINEICKSISDFIIDSLTETFGEIPIETINLINIAVVKRLAGGFKVKNIVVKSGETYMEFEDFKSLNNEKLLTAIDCFGSRVKLSMSSLPKLEFQNAYSSNVQMLGVLREFLTLAVR